MRFPSRAAAVMALALAAAGARAQDGHPAAPPPPILLRHATLLDGVAATPRRNVAITLRDGRIASIRPDVPGRAPAPDSVIDLRGAWVLPGLIDAHVHMGIARLWGEPDSSAAERALDGGVTTLRSMGYMPGFGDVALKESYLAGSRLPRMSVAGEWLVPIVGEDWLRDFPTIRSLLAAAAPADSVRQLSPGPGWRLTGNAAAIDSAVGVLKGRGADWVKVFASGRAQLATSNPLTPFLTESDLGAAVRAARRRGLRVAAHAHSADGIKAAVLAGVNTIEHGTYASDETLRLMRDRRTCLVPTLSSWQEPSENPALRARSATMGAAAQHTVRQAHALGVSIVAGTDGVYAPGAPGLVTELRALLQAGLSADEVLRAATSGSARCLGLSDRIGRIAPGLQADLLVVDGDPRADLSRLDRPKLVIQGGRLVRRTPFASIIGSVLAGEGIDAARARAEALLHTRVDSIRYGEFELLELANQLHEEKRDQDAIALVQVNVAGYPEGANSWEMLGFGLLAAGRRTDAQAAFERAVSLAEKHQDPQLPRLRAELERVKRGPPQSQ